MRRCIALLFVLAILSASVLVSAAPDEGADARALLAGVADKRALPVGADVPSGILYDRVLPLSRIERFDGRSDRMAAGMTLWAQIYDELRRAADESPLVPFRIFRTDALRSAGTGRVPIAILNMRYDRIREDAFERGLLTVRNGRIEKTGENPYREARAFAACALRGQTHRGARVVFSFDDRWYITNDGAALRSIEADFDDGAGTRAVVPGSDAAISYTSTGTKRISLRATLEDGTVLKASFPFVVEHLETPIPSDTLAVTAAIPYAGVAGTGEAYVHLSTLNTQLTDPVIVIEGFDLDNTMNWDELYQLLNQESLADTLSAEGYDLVLLNFTDATDYIQRNAFVVIELIQQVLGMINPSSDITVVGPSMGGLAGRYALAYMERESIVHRVRTFISFDGPQRGANIPLGVQYWMQFFAGESESAAFLLERLDRPAARQMLLYHHTNPPTAGGEADPLRGTFLADLAAAGDYPQEPRLVAVANGSGAGADQGFAPGDQIIFYEYESWLVDIIGNVWAVPNGASTIVFDGVINRIWPFPDDAMQVVVSGTRPLDGAPGGWRNSMYQMDTTQAPYGDIVALHPNHCFIPTISALDIDTEDLWYDIAGDPDIMSRTPFDTIYYPAANEEHVTISAEGAQWFMHEIRHPVTGTGAPLVAARAALRQNYPNPFNPATVVTFDLAARGRVRVEIYDVLGRRVTTMADRVFEAGRHRLSWDGRDNRGRAVASGVYICRLDTSAGRDSKKMILAR
jgi:hypothetical protein